MVDHPVLNDSETYKIAEFKLICSPGSSNPSTVELSLKKGNILKNLCFAGVEGVQFAGDRYNISGFISRENKGWISTLERDEGDSGQLKKKVIIVHL